MIEQAKKFVLEHAKTSIYNPDIDVLTDEEWEQILAVFKIDAKNYGLDLNFSEIKYFPGLLVTFYYRIATLLYHSGREYLAKDYSYLGFSLSGSELYYSAKIGKGLKINHGFGVVIGAEVVIGDNVTLHHNVGMGKNRKDKESPRIGDNTVIYPGTSISGNISIGDNVVIGANNFIERNIPNGETLKRGRMK